MNDEQLSQLFSKQNIPPVDEAAKARALKAALGAFTAQQMADNTQTRANSAEYVIEVNASEVVQSERPQKIINFFSRLFQGFLTRLRPTHHIHPSRSNTMNFSQQRFMFSGLATCAVIAVGAIYINQNPWRKLSPEVAVLSENGQIGAIDRILVEKKDVPSNELLHKAGGAVDAIEAEDTGKLPDTNLAESLQRISGVAVERKEEKLAAEVVSNFALSPAIHATDKEMAAPPAIPKQTAKALGAIGSNTEATNKHTSLADTVAPSNPKEFRDRFETFKENPATAVSSAPVSTFSIDVDTAAYSFTRRQLNSGNLPAKDAVRLEEMINYFPYNYPMPESKKIPFKPSITVLDSPFKAGNKLVHIGIKGYQIPTSEIPRSNLVFLLDVSGSMNEPDKLPLVQQSMGILLESLKPDDTVAIVIYAGAAGMVLKPTPVKEKTKILAAINNLQAGGSTAGAEGIALAYQLAETNFNPKGVNRIILATDGDFNVGPTGDKDLKDYVERKREKGIYLSVLGFGQGNYQDAVMQTLAQNGNGVAAYIDTLSEAQKVLVQEATSALFPIANDVKIQVEFNPATVAEYRLLGYETRALKREDFNNDKIDAGEIGSGHSVTAIYEITPITGGKPLIDPSRYTAEQKVKKDTAREYGFLRMRYKTPGDTKSQLIETAILIDSSQNSIVKSEAEFSTAVASFSQILRGSAYSGDMTYDKVIELAQKNKGQDEYGYRTEFIQLVRKAKVAKAL